MWLLNLNNPGREGQHHILIEAGRIKTVTNRLPSMSRNEQNVHIHFGHAVVFPGLINSHDHLDFSLFPPIGNRIYSNYVDWGADIHSNNKELINSIAKIPQSLAVQWGVYKNLLAGVTTVIHHGNRVEIADACIGIRQEYQSIHSVMRGKNWRLHLNNPRKRKTPVVIHAGEGTDAIVKQEVDSLLRWNLFKRPMIAVHGISMNEAQAARFKAMIWCPGPNIFLYGQTAAVDRIQHHTNLLFGSDSPLTGSWNFWDHLRSARDCKMISDGQLFNLVNIQAASTWNLQNGKIEPGAMADLVIGKSQGDAATWGGFYNLNPADLQLVIHKGAIRLFDETLTERLKADISLNDYSKVYINGTAKYVEGDLPGLINKIHRYNSEIQFPVNI